MNNAAATAVALAWPDDVSPAASPEVGGEPWLALAASLALLAPLLLAYQRTMPPAPEGGAALARAPARPGRLPGWVRAALFAAAVALALIALLSPR